MPDYWDQFTPEKEDYWSQYEEAEPLDSSFGSGYGLPSLQDIYSTALKIPGKVIETGVGALDLMQAPWRSMSPGVPAVSSVLRDKFGYDPEGWEQEISANEDSPELKAARQEHGQADGFVESINSYWRNPGLALLEAEESAVPMYMGGVLGRAARPILGAVKGSALGEAAITAADQASQIRRENGEFRPEDFVPAVGSGIATGLISGASGKLANKVGLPDVDQFLADPSITGVRRLPALAAGGLMEMPEEGLQSYQEQVATNLATDKPWNEGAASAAVGGAVGGGLMGGTIPMFRRGAPSSPSSEPDLSGGRDQGVDTGVFGEDEEAVGTSFVVSAKDATEQFIKDARDMGFVPAGMLPGGKTLFKAINATDAVEEPNITQTQDTVTEPTTDLPLNPPLTGEFGQGEGVREGETTGRVAQMPVSADQALNSILTGPRDEASVDAAANDFVMRVSKITDPMQLTRMLQSIQLQPQTAITRGLIDVVQRRLNETQPHMNYQAPPPNIPTDSIDASTYTEEDRARMAENLRRMLSPPSPNERPLFEDEEARAILDRAMPPPTPEPELPTEYGQNALDEEARQWLLNQDRIIGANQEANGPLMGQSTAITGPIEQARTGEIVSADPTQYGPKGEGFLRRTLRANPNLSPADIAQMHEFLVQLDAPVSGDIEGGGLERVAEQSGMPSYEEQKADLDARQDAGMVADYEEELAALNESYGVISGMSAEMEDYVDKVQRAKAEGYKVYPPGYKADPDEPVAYTFEADGETFRAVGYRHLVTPDNPTGRYNKQTNQLPPGDSGVSRMGVERFTPRSDDHVNYNKGRGKVQIYNLAEDLNNELAKGIPDNPRIETIMAHAEQLLTEETDPQIIEDNYHSLNEYAERAHLPEGSPDHIELFGQLRDTALDKFRQGPNNFLTKMTGVPPEDFVRMEVGERAAILRNMQGSYAEHGARVANKELLQNAIDATPTGGTIEVTIDFQNLGGKGTYIMVTDEGPGLPIDMIKNEFVTLTGSGKRGQTSATGRKTIGEMGVGKATYLLGTDSFEVTTVANEPDGTTWKYEFKGDADTMIGEDSQGNPVPPMKINKTQMPAGTPTGTSVIIRDKDLNNLKAAREYLKTFAEYSDTPVTVKIETNEYPNNKYLRDAYDVNKTVTPRTTVNGQHVHSGSTTGADYSIHVPTAAKWTDRVQQIAVIMNARGMFQGVETVYVSAGSLLPDRVVLNIEPTVSAQDAKNYPLTSPTREKMKGPFKQEITNIIHQHLVTAAKDKSKADIKAAYDALVPQKDSAGRQLNFVTNDRGGRYTKQELANFNNDPSVQGIAHYIGNMLNDLNRQFSTQQITKTIKYGYDIADLGAGGINIQDVANPNENAILIGLFDALNQAGGDPKIAGELIAHTVLHEFNHNRARNEGADFTYKLRDTDAKFGTDRRGAYAKAIESLITDGRGGFNLGIRKLIQEHTAARGRQDTTIDFIARQEKGGFLAAPGQDSVSEDNQESGDGTTGLVSEMRVPGWDKVQQATGIGSGGANVMKKGQLNWVKEALAVPSSATTTMDLSAPFRQGLSQIHTKQFWKAIVPMLKAGYSDQIFQIIDQDLRNKPVMQARRNRQTGKVKPSIAQEAGLKMFETASTGGMNQRAQATASRWLEQGIGTDPISRLWKNTVGRPIRASNRAYITFLNHLKVNRFEHLMNQSAAMGVEAARTGSARPGIFKQSYTPQEALELNGYRNKVLAKEIADFVNTATGQGPLKTHVLPTKHAEVSLESAAGALQHIMFSPGLMASRVRMLNPNTYIMASPMVRKQYMKAALATGTAWMSALAMMKLGGGDEVEVNMENMTSADWAKAKIGDTRLDPGGGFQQFLVSMARMIQGGTTSSASGEWREFGEGFMAQSQKSNIERFLSNKLNPITKFAYDLASQSEYNPFHVYDRTAQLFVPLVIQDLIGLYYEDPEMLPWMAPIMFGMGTQTYGRGESVGKLVAPENDWLASGGGFMDLGKSEDSDTY